MREGRCHALLIFGWLTGLLAGGRAEAVNPETLLMPGKLSTAHVKYEETCALCHDRSDRSKQRRLCLDCHKEIAGDLLVTVETQPPLLAAVAAVVTERARLLVFHVSRAQLARHEERLG